MKDDYQERFDEYCKYVDNTEKDIMKFNDWEDGLIKIVERKENETTKNK